MDYAGRTRDALRIQNDDAAVTQALLRAEFTLADRQLKPGAAIYVCHPAGTIGLTFGEEFRHAGWNLEQALVWLKDSMVLGHSDYHYRHEPILYGHKPGRRGGRRGTRGWYGDRRQASVFEVPRPKASRDHPTMKPVQLVEIALLNSTRPGDTVLDPFLGSGTTLIACEKLQRRCVGIEIDPVCGCRSASVGGVCGAEGGAR